ncbi:uracil-DNA glycosylase [soil metagenome]
MKINLESSTLLKTASQFMSSEWRQLLKAELTNDNFKQLSEFIDSEIKSGFAIYPPTEKIFAAFNFTPLSAVKVVIIGQDPYHGIGQANGLCFSVADGIRRPPSLLNIFKELEVDLGYPIPQSGNLESWAHQGVLLLNATLTVRAETAGSHQHKGWELFTDEVIRKISLNTSGIVFLLWGKYAAAKAALVDADKHSILIAAHPSPLARTGFKGCRHFSKANDVLISSGKKPVNWKL